MLLRIAALILFTVLHFTNVFATPVDSIRFSGVWWKPIVCNADDGNGTTIYGTDGNRWYSDDNSQIDTLADGSLRLRFTRKLNEYYYFPTDANSYRRTRDSLILRNVLRQDTSQGWYQKVYERIRDSLVWYGVSLTSVDKFRYGKFQWEMATVFPDTFNTHIIPAYWIIDSLQRGPGETQGNEIDFEFCRFLKQHSWVRDGAWVDNQRATEPWTEWPMNQNGWWDTLGHYYDEDHQLYPNITTVQPNPGPAPGTVFPVIPPSTLSTVTYPERRASLDFTSYSPEGHSIRSFQYTPDTVTFWNFWDDDTVTWQFPRSDSAATPRIGIGQTSPSAPIYASKTMIVPECGSLTQAKISILQWGRSYEWHYDPNSRVDCKYVITDENAGIGNSGFTQQQISSGVIELITKSFTYTGIPDLSFRDTVGAPWPWATGDWHPSGWQKSMMVTNDSTVSITTIDSTHSCDTIRYGERAWVYWAVRNVGTATIPLNEGISTSFYDNDELLFTRQRLDSLAIGATLYDSVQLSLEPGNHWLKLITGVEYGGSSLEELRKNNNADSIQVFVAGNDSSGK